MNPDMYVFDIETYDGEYPTEFRVLKNRSVDWGQMSYQQAWTYDGKFLKMINHPDNLQDHFKDDKELFTL